MLLKAQVSIVITKHKRNFPQNASVSASQGGIAGQSAGLAFRHVDTNVIAMTAP
ncbi:MAG: hypothetical protein Q8L06_10785 [Pseudohongiella sp.]|nr:hypothetical protein [Pseudohongiella sp.]